ncbi:potassium-transporting ATPase subunit KdpC [Pigmentiphaga aceris]|uniref:Potassium-transporting ATPase KdpC subunit n=1 Tax=Pigmentiphaga aceris TaxID=1940612 RepID=A0A5C0AZ84_9BURK|nr:potassium-transporting ATPase subunit KdpC [Pigmentiphaga aceris]QEI07495.1 potassium-transporting ATPase subunit KdpC [Pigmentiphaga aceris]
MNSPTLPIPSDAGQRGTHGGTPARFPERSGVLRPALVLFAALTLVTGVLYPLATTGVAKLMFPFQASGSLIERDGKVVGSTLIGQAFSSPQYFWGRPSATGPMPYNASASSGSNLGPTNPALRDAVVARIEALRQADPGNSAQIPVDLVSTSASGLDPHISPAAANYQAARVARLRKLSLDNVHALIQAHTERPLIGILGEPVVNVLTLNLALDEAKQQ